MIDGLPTLASAVYVIRRVIETGYTGVGGALLTRLDHLARRLSVLKTKQNQTHQSKNTLCYCMGILKG